MLSGRKIEWLSVGKSTGESERGKWVMAEERSLERVRDDGD